MRNLQKMEDLKTLCCTEVERAQQLTIDELSLQEKECQSTVHQLTVQIRELQDKVNSLSHSRELNDPETSNSFGLSHTPSHPMSISRRRGMLGHDSCLQPHTRNLCGTLGNVV